MNTDEHFIALEKKMAVLEYRVQEQQKRVEDMKNSFCDTIANVEKLLLEIKENPFGANS